MEQVGKGRPQLAHCLELGVVLITPRGHRLSQHPNRHRDTEAVLQWKRAQPR